MLSYFETRDARIAVMAEMYSTERVERGVAIKLGLNETLFFVQSCLKGDAGHVLACMHLRIARMMIAGNPFMRILEGTMAIPSFANEKAVLWLPRS